MLQISSVALGEFSCRNVQYSKVQVLIGPAATLNVWWQRKSFLCSNSAERVNKFLVASLMGVHVPNFVWNLKTFGNSLMFDCLGSEGTLSCSKIVFEFSQLSTFAPNSTRRNHWNPVESESWGMQKLCLKFGKIGPVSHFFSSKKHNMCILCKPQTCQNIKTARASGIWREKAVTSISSEQENKAVWWLRLFASCFLPFWLLSSYGYIAKQTWSEIVSNRMNRLPNIKMFKNGLAHSLFMILSVRTGYLHEQDAQWTRTCG